MIEEFRSGYKCIEGNEEEIGCQIVGTYIA